jgi:hypothetical protein
LVKKATPPTRSERSERTNTYTLLRGEGRNEKQAEKQENEKNDEKYRQNHQ